MRYFRSDINVAAGIKEVLLYFFKTIEKKVKKRKNNLKIYKKGILEVFESNRIDVNEQNHFCLFSLLLAATIRSLKP